MPISLGKTISSLYDSLKQKGPSHTMTHQTDVSFKWRPNRIHHCNRDYKWTRILEHMYMLPCIGEGYKRYVQVCLYPRNLHESIAQSRRFWAREISALERWQGLANAWPNIIISATVFMRHLQEMSRCWDLQEAPPSQTSPRHNGHTLQHRINETLAWDS